jgi:hypothetical protein
MNLHTLRRAGRVVMALAAIVVAVVGAAAVAPVSAATVDAKSLSIFPKYGYHIEHGGDFVGVYRASNGTLVYCLNPSKAEPRTINLATFSRIPHLSKTVTAELAEALYAHGRARTNWEAAVMSQTLNTLAGNKRDVARRAHFVPASVGQRAASYVAEARRFHGPYRVRVSTPKALLPGQSAHGTVAVTPARPGVTVRLASPSNAAVTRTVRTGPRGTATFTYRVISTGEVHIAAQAVNLAPTTLLANNPSAFVQRMVSWKPALTASASASFQLRPSGFSNAYACTTTCNGRPVIKLSACAAASTEAQRILYHYAGHVTAINWSASNRASCKSMSITLKDGHRVSATRQYRTPRGWSAQVAVAGTFVIDCPPAPGAAATVVFSCTTASVTIGLGTAGANGAWTPMTNTSTRGYVLVIGGAVTKHVYADHGKKAVATFTMACGAHKTFTFRGGVRRANGQYNYTPKATIISP